MGQRSQVLLLLAFIKFLVVGAQTDPNDAAALMALGSSWENKPSNWVRSDPCGGWVGIECINSRVTSIILTSMNLTGQLSVDIGSLSELQTLDLSSNTFMTGPLPQAIGNLKKLSILCLTGCGFSGPIPNEIGSLPQLLYLALNTNRFSGQIPSSIGNLSNLDYLDLTENQLSGSIPVSSGNKSGLDMLLQTKHFHLGKNQLSGTIPPQLFSSNMKLIHVLFDNNNLSGIIPSTLGLVQTLEVVRLDRNSLNGSVPSNISNLANLRELALSNNSLTGPMPNLTSMNLLNYVDMSNNSFDSSGVPPWISSLQSLTTLMMERTQLEGPIPVNLFSPPNIEIVDLSNNNLNGTLNISTTYSHKLQRIILRNNSIAKFEPITGGNNLTISLEDNPVCEVTGQVTESYCNNSTSSLPNSMPPNCLQLSCSSDQVASPNCKCGYPYKGTLFFRALSSLDLGNSSYYVAVEESLMQTFQSYDLPVDSVSLSNPTIDSFGYLGLSLQVFPSGDDRFNKTGITMIGYVLNNLSFSPPRLFGPFFLIASIYDYYAGSNKGKSKGIIIGAAVGGSLLLVGYMDPEYYMTQQLTEKSDVYSFGVLLLELITARRPIEQGKHIVKEVRNAMDKTKELYNLHEILDPAIGLGTTLKGSEKFVDLAMRCVEESGAERPTMGEVVKEIENIMQLFGLNPIVESASTSETYDVAGKGHYDHPYIDDGFNYSGSFPPSMTDPK
ncbi:leucine-rich repeat receptor protein kinase HPCA1-like [Corylus avellana]|uniref:leucine-rich repeat receptor protein kinase HPCA1-like n=1 Tax=Corylus avellana TaxID=13451 RepID=UPI00286C851D|nr:leucine-rich repeat receptor protein kinase HPCA1-like [Corylus avellana]